MAVSLGAALGVCASTVTSAAAPDTCTAAGDSSSDAALDSATRTVTLLSAPSGLRTLKVAGNVRSGVEVMTKLVPDSAPLSRTSNGTSISSSGPPSAIHVSISAICSGGTGGRPAGIRRNWAPAVPVSRPNGAWPWRAMTMVDPGPSPSVTTGRPNTSSATNSSRVLFLQNGPCGPPTGAPGPPTELSRISTTRWNRFIPPPDCPFVALSHT